MIVVFVAACLVLAGPPEPDALDAVLRELDHRAIGTQPHGAPPTPPASAPSRTEPVVEESPTPTEGTPPPRVAIERSTTPPILEPPPIPRPMRRPGAWIAGGTAMLGVSAVMHFIIPVLGRCRAREVSCNDQDFGGGAICEANTCNLTPIVTLRVLSLAVDAATFTLWGFGGSAYGLRNARRNPPAHRLEPSRRALLGGGVALAIAGGALLIGVGGSGLIVEKPAPLSYTFAGIRMSGVILGAAGASMLGYTVSLWHGSVGVRRSAFTVQPMLGRTAFGLSLQLR